MAAWEGFARGVVGGLFGELLTWFRLRRRSKMPNHWRSVQYWFLTAGMCISGGLLVVAYIRSDVSIKPILAINIGASNIGASTPLLIQAFVSTAPSLEPGLID